MSATPFQNPQFRTAAAAVLCQFFCTGCDRLSGNPVLVCIGNRYLLQFLGFCNGDILVFAGFCNLRFTFLDLLTPDRTKPITARKLGDDFDTAAVLALLRCV